MTSERGSEQGRGLDPVPIKGETFGEWRARKGESGTDTHAARSLAWDGDGWAKISEVDAVRAPVEPEHADGCAYYFADAADAESLCNCRGTSPRIIVEAGKPLPVSFSGLRAAGYEVAEPATREPPAPTDDPGAELARQPALSDLLPALPEEIRRALLGADPTRWRLARTCKLLLGERERLTREAPRPSPDRAAWLLHPVSSTGRETIAASQYEELRIEAVALRARMVELEARAHLWCDNDARAVDGWARVAELEAEVAKERAAFTGANTAWSRAVVLQEQAQDERDAMRARAEEAERKSRYMDETVKELSSANGQIADMRAKLRVASAGVEDVWRWAGDGDDHPESMSCPVVMSAATLREFVAARERVATLGAPTPLDRAVAEVVALGQRPHPDSETNAADYLDHIETLATEMAPLDEPWEDIESERDRCKWIAALGLAGMLACDAADGGGKEQSK